MADDEIHSEALSQPAPAQPAIERALAGPKVVGGGICADEDLAVLQEQLRTKDAELREMSQRLRLVLESSRLGTWEWNILDGRAVWSEEQYRLFGLEPFSIEATLEAFYQRLHPDDRPRGDAMFEEARRERRFFETEYRVVWPNGEVHWLQARGRFAFNDDGELLRMFGVTLDIDRLKHAEQTANDTRARLQTIAEATPGTIFTYREADGERSFPYATPHLRETHGIEPEDLMRDSTLLLARIHPDDAARVAASSIESGRRMSMWHSQFRHNHPDKGEVWLEAYSSPIRDPDGGGVTWHGIVHDITQMKRTEIELTTARQQAEAADRAKSEFLANMSHEIRTPMSAIMGYADILSEQLTDPDNLQNLGTIRSNGRYLLEIIDDILDLSRIEAGKLHLDFERVHTDRLVLDVRSLLNVHAMEKGLALTVGFDGQLPETIETDPTRLRQILINLIGNAIKFTDQGEVNVVLRLLAAESRLQIEVRDTGVGIPDAMLETLFRPFTQADSSVTRRFGGSGLGLSICRALAELLGGDIVVTTAIGKGSTFALTIGVGDLAGVPFVDPCLGGWSTPVAERQLLRSLECNVLVVDDRREMRHLAQHVLEEAGADVVLAVDGRDALNRVSAAEERGQPFDAILLDMQMPVLDGYAAAEELRRQGYGRPIIALTAHAMKADEDKCRACGCDEYLRKPLERATLVNAVAHYTQDVSLADLSARRAAAAPVPTPAESHCKVLLVDDNEDACLMAKLLLERAGCEVVAATNGAAALAVGGAFDAVVLDLGLPGMSGAEVAARLKTRRELQRCRFICLTGRGMSEIDWRALGFDHFLRKPASFAELKRILDLPQP